MERVAAVKELRLNSKSRGTRKLADTPTHFHVTNLPKEKFLLLPCVSSENRKYIPIGYLPENVIASNTALIISCVSLFHFGVLTSNVHMAWMRTVAGRLEMRYRYSKDIVYNNFIWPDCTEEQVLKIIQTSQNILDTRAKYPDESYADLYDDTVMPFDLRRAHQVNDRAVWDAYGRAWPITDEAACVAHLMKLYQEHTTG